MNSPVWRFQNAILWHIKNMSGLKAEIAFVATLLLPVILGVGYTCWSGSTYNGVGGIEALTVHSQGFMHGQRAMFTCLWTDGKIALMENDEGLRRLVRINEQSQNRPQRTVGIPPLTVGKKYVVIRDPGFKGIAGGRTYLAAL